MSDITFQMTANDADVTKALQNLVKENAKLREEIAKGVQQSKDEAKAAKEAAEAQKAHSAAMKEAEAVVKRNMTASERYSAEIDRLNKLRDKGVLSATDHARAVEAEQKKMATGAETSTKFSTALSDATTKMVTAAAGVVSLTAVVQGLRAEYENLIAVQGKSKDAQLTLAAEQEALLMNLGGANAGQVTGQIRDLSRKSGVKEVDVTRAVNEAMAARGDLAVGDIIQAVGTATKVRKFAPQELAGLAAATIDTQKQTGLGTDASLGFLLQLQAQSRTKNLKSLAENFTPAVGGVMQFGADRQTAGALLAALSHGMGDTQGSTSATAAIQLSKQLREFGGGAPIAQTLQNLQQNAGLRQQFLGNASFEAKALPAIESLLGGGRQAQQFNAARQALGQNPLASLNEAIAARTPAALQVAGLQNALQNQLDQRRLEDPLQAVSAIIRDFRQTNTSESSGVFATKIQDATELLRTGGTEGFDRVMRDAQMLGMSDTRKLGPMSPAEIAAMRVGTGAPKTVPLSPEELAKVTEADKARAAEARAMYEVLQEIRDALKDGKNQGAAVGRANQREGAGT